MKTRAIAAILLIFTMIFCGCARREVTTLEMPGALETTAALPVLPSAPEAPEVEAAPEATEPVVLTLAIAADCPVLFSFGQMFRDFNSSQSRYRIEYTIYSDSGLTDTQPAELLRTQILAGGAPDLYAFYTEGYTAPPLTPERVGVDLLPLVGELATADTLVPGLFDLMTADGALYELPLTVAVDTVIAPARLLPEPGVTLDELEQARAQMPDGWTPVGSWNTPDNLFAGFCTAYCIGAYTDRASGTCDFAQQSFYDFLTWCKTWGGDGSIPPGAAAHLADRVARVARPAQRDRARPLVRRAGVYLRRLPDGGRQHRQRLPRPHVARRQPAVQRRGGRKGGSGILLFVCAGGEHPGKLRAFVRGAGRVHRGQPHRLARRGAAGERGGRGAA